jgi:nucleoid-associated protein EbfC
MTESRDSDGSNPLDALGLGGGGGFDMGALLQQAQQMQQQLQEAQLALAESTVEGTAGGDAVKVTVSGVGELKAVAIKPGNFDADDADDLTDLGDLIVAAYRDAKSRADAMAAQTLGPMAQAMGGGGFPGLG